MDHLGHSKKWNASKDNMLRIYELFCKEKNLAAWRNGNPTFLSSWDEITEEALTSKPLYAHFADYLAKEYTDRSGNERRHGDERGESIGGLLWRNPPLEICLGVFGEENVLTFGFG